MEKFKAFCKRKNIEVSAKRYGIDALGAMAQGLFCSLLIGTIIKTLGAQLGVPFLTDIGTYAMSVSGPAMAIAIGYALQAPPLVLFSLAAVGYACNLLGGAGGVEAVFTALALRDQYLPATINYRTADPECDLDVVPNAGRNADLRCVLSNSLGFGGHNGSLLMKKWEA